MRDRRWPFPAAAGALLALAACDPASLGGGPQRQGKVEIDGVPVVVAGPPGFCLDASSTAADRDGAFVLLSDCALLSGVGATFRRPVDAVLTASLSAAEAGGGATVQSIADVGRFAKSAAGRGLIGQGGDGQFVPVLATHRQEGAVFLLVEDRGRQPLAGIEPRFWRGFVDLGGRLGVVTVLAFEGGDVDAQAGLALASAFATALRRANGS